MICYSNVYSWSIMELVDHKMQFFYTFFPSAGVTNTLTAPQLHPLCNTYISQPCHTEYINISDVLYFELVRMSLSILISVHVLHSSSSPFLPPEIWTDFLCVC